MDSRLTSPIAILLGAIIIAAGIIAAQFVDRYQIAPATDHDGNPFLWRLNVRTGEIQRCSFVSRFAGSSSTLDSKSQSPNPYDENWPAAALFQFSCTKDIRP
jgi:hypothetical protein